MIPSRVITYHTVSHHMIPHHTKQHHATEQAKTTSYKVINVTRNAVAASISTSVLAWENLDLRHDKFQALILIFVY